jgi:hypothetical protein
MTSNEIWELRQIQKMLTKANEARGNEAVSRMEQTEERLALFIEHAQATQEVA